MEELLPILLLLFGFALVVLEVFIPSLGVLTLGAVAIIVVALYLGFSQSTGLGVAMAAAVLVGVPLILVAAFKLFPETPLGRHMMLRRQPTDHPAPATQNRPELVGREGTARSDLRPSGVAEVDGERLGVVTRGELVEAGARIRIIENLGNRIVVRSIEPAADDEEENLS